VAEGKTSFDIEQELKPLLKSDNERLVFGCLANNMALPFKDESFDCYISNFSMHIVPDYKKQLSEAFRVAKKGAKIGISLLGRKESNVIFFSSLREVLQKNNLGT
jgi:ubiquinone/menaquinone biosynthesis C-methylase UbiE